MQGHDQQQSRETGASGSAWYVAQVQPQREKLAAFHLERQGFIPFSPIIVHRRARAGRTIAVREPLFPGYNFVRFDRGRDAWRSINGTIGVSRLVMFGDEPARLPEGLVEGLIELHDDNEGITFDSDLRVGAGVRIVGGAFDNMVGTLFTADSQSRVTVLLDMLSGPRKVSVPRERLIEA
jgi:transcriptional antiterminator RfaH